jgi:hypothetical protein
MKSIYTLIPDVQEVLSRDGWFTDELGIDLASRLKGTLGDPQAKPTLRLSQMGPRCPKALWHSIHTPHLAELLPPSAKFKFQYGHIIEELAITLFKAAGHDVKGEQDAVELDGVTGHRDCVVDGAILDVKSSSTPGFKKFEDGSIANPGADTFGYLDQIDGYLCASLSDPLVTVKDRAYLFVIDKTLGHMCLYEHLVTEERMERLRARIAKYKQIVAMDSPPACECGTIVEDNGNVKLDVRAGYNQFKDCCFPLLRRAVYAGGKPQFFAHVAKWPKNSKGPLLEVDKFGDPVYNAK